MLQIICSIFFIFLNAVFGFGSLYFYFHLLIFHRSFISSGEILKYKASNGHINNSNSHLEAANSDVEVLFVYLCDSFS